MDVDSFIIVTICFVFCQEAIYKIRIIQIYTYMYIIEFDTYMYIIRTIIKQKVMCNDDATSFD